MLFSFALPCLQLAMAQTTTPPPKTQEYIPVSQDYDTFVENVRKADTTGVQNNDSYYLMVFNRVTLALLHILGGDLVSGKSTASSNNNGLLGFTTGFMGGMYSHQPVSAVAYFRDLGQQAGVVDKAYAQAQDSVQGFNRLQPLLPLWRAMRNIAYMLYVPIFIFIGITIMLRQKINPQTVASVQNAIPKIVLSLILVTFSFAIVGFMIDLVYFAMALLTNYFADQGFIAKDFITRTGGDNIYSENIFRLVKSDFNINNFADIVAEAIKDITAEIIKLPGILNLVGQGASAALGGLAKLIAIGAVIFVLFRVLFMLIMAYIGILGLTVLGPLIIVFDAIPGRNGFAFWIKSLLANLIVFPAVLALLLFAAVVGGVGPIAGDVKLNFATKDGINWVPPFLGSFAGRGIETFVPFVAFGAVLMMPTMLAQLQKFMKTQLNLGPLLEPVQQAAAPIQGLLGGAGQQIYQRSPAYTFTEGQRIKAKARAIEKANLTEKQEKIVRAEA